MSSNDTNDIDVDPWAWNADCDEYPDMATVTKNLRQRFALNPAGSAGERIIDVNTGTGYTVDGWVLQYSAFNAFYEDDNGVRKSVSASKLFLSDPDKTTVEGRVFRPGVTGRLIPVDGKLMVNTWVPRAPGPEVTEEEIDHAGDLFEAFVAGIIPDKDDRDYVVNWIARKVQCPAERGVSMIFVSETKGTGKGALFTLIEAMVGERWSSAMKIGDLLGVSAAASYMAEIQHKLLIVVHEAQTDGKDRKKGAENLKTYISPMPERVPLNPKGVNAYSEWVFFSALIASNNPESAVPVDNADRRFSVIRLIETPLIHNHDAKAALDELMPEDRFTATHGSKRVVEALYKYLMSLETDKKMFQSVLENEARDEMISGGDGEVERAATKVLSGLPKDRRGYLFDTLVDMVHGELHEFRSGGQRTTSRHMISGVLRELLKRNRATQSNERIRGFGGWVHLGKKDVAPPEGVEWEVGGALTRFEPKDREARWQTSQLVVRLRYEEASVAERGDILQEAMDNNSRMLKLVPGGKKRAQEDS